MCAKDAHSAPPQVHDHGKFSVNPGSLPGLAHLFLLSSIWTESQSMQRPSVKLTICKECVRKGGKLEQYLSKEGARKVHDAQILVKCMSKINANLRVAQITKAEFRAKMASLSALGVPPWHQKCGSKLPW